MSQPGSGATPGGSELVAWIRNWIHDQLGLEPAAIGTNRTFISLGVDSIHAMMLVGDLEHHLSRRLPPTLAWDHPTIEALAAHLSAPPSADGD